MPSQHSPKHKQRVSDRGLLLYRKLVLTKHRSANAQLQDLSGVFKIPEDLPGGEKLKVLRELSADALVEALPKLQMSNFRAVTDGAMIHADMMRQFEDGTFATRFRDRGYRLLTGETETEVSTCQSACSSLSNPLPS